MVESIHDPAVGQIKTDEHGIQYEWRGKMLGWRAVGNDVTGLANTPRRGEPEGSRDRHVHDACMTPREGDIKYVAGIEYVRFNNTWRSTGKAVTGTVSPADSPAARLETDSARPTFSHERYDLLVKETVDKLIELGKFKGAEYAGDDDRLANFRRNGLALDLPMEAIWHTYTAKHWDAVAQYIKDLIHGKERKRLEQDAVDDDVV